MACSSKSDGAAPASARPLVRSGLTVGWSASDLVFEDELELTFEKSAVLVTSDFFVTERIALQLGAGYVPGGAVEAGDRFYAVAAGALASGGGSWRVVEDEGYAPYVVFSASLAVLRAALADDSVPASPARASYVAVDGRFGATVGKTFSGVVSPYLSLRVFGGPVFFDDGLDVKLGTDRYHVQPAAGVVGILPGGVDIFVEIAPVLERSFSGGLGYAW